MNLQETGPKTLDELLSDRDKNLEPEKFDNINHVSCGGDGCDGCAWCNYTDDDDDIDISGLDVYTDWLTILLGMSCQSDDDDEYCDCAYCNAMQLNMFSADTDFIRTGWGVTRPVTSERMSIALLAQAAEASNRRIGPQWGVESTGEEDCSPFDVEAELDAIMKLDFLIDDIQAMYE